MEIYLTAKGLVLIFMPAAILLLMKHFDVQSVEQHIVDRMKGYGVGNKNHFPRGFETESLLESRDKYIVLLFFMPGMNLYFLFWAIYKILKTIYYKHIYLKTIKTHRT